MKELSEEEIQRMLEQQLKEDGKQGLPGNEEDAALYQILFTALADEPVTLQNTDLTEAIVRQIKISERKAEALRYNIIIAAVLVGGVLSAYFAVAYINPNVLKSAMSFLDAYKWIFVFVTLCFAIIEIADKNLVKRRFVDISLVH